MILKLKPRIYSHLTGYFFYLFDFSFEIIPKPSNGASEIIIETHKKSFSLTILRYNKWNMSPKNI